MQNIYVYLCNENLCAFIQNIYVQLCNCEIYVHECILQIAENHQAKPILYILLHSLNIHHLITALSKYWILFVLFSQSVAINIISGQYAVGHFPKNAPYAEY